MDYLIQGAQSHLKSVDNSIERPEWYCDCCFARFESFNPKVIFCKERPRNKAYWLYVCDNCNEEEQIKEMDAYDKSVTFEAARINEIENLKHLKTK